MMGQVLEWRGKVMREGVEVKNLGGVGIYQSGLRNTDGLLAHRRATIHLRLKIDNFLRI